MIVSDVHEYVYLRVPRTATLSLTRYLCQHCAGHPLTPLPEWYHHMRVPEPWSARFVFAVVRNPYARLASMWRHIHHEQRYPHSFAALLQYLGAHGRKGPRLSQHWWSTQKELLAQAPPLSWRGRFETLYADLAQLPFVPHTETELRDVLPLTHFYGAYDWQQLYTPELAAITQQLYGEDFEEYGYARESWRPEWQEIS